ncbi:MAG TPA: hypothetical protein VNF75_03580 [Candidatus Dormibacteraeota bacterium]|nr:hypothetical protein [Candidatus Dormibacteraeota bacterium]
MGDLSAGAQALMPYWGAIQGAVGSRASTAEVWTALRGASDAMGIPIPAGAFLAVNQLRSMAVQVRTAGEALGSAAAEAGLTSAMIGQAPYGRTLQEQALAPAWEVRFQNTLRIDGAESTIWSTTYYYGSLPATAGELISGVTADAAMMAGNYGAEASLGISNVHVNAF